MGRKGSTAKRDSWRISDNGIKAGDTVEVTWNREPENRERGTVEGVNCGYERDYSRAFGHAWVRATEDRGTWLKGVLYTVGCEALRVA